jgi:HD-like signal output (HDOD) protein
MKAVQLDQLVQRAESLPKLPHASARLIPIISDPTSTLQQIVDVIRYDQTVTTELLRLCNSAYFALSRPITSIDDAVRFLGTAKLMQLVMVAHTHALLGPEQAGYGLLPGALWQHSVGVALACQILAERRGMAEKGLPFTVGLLHDIGKIVLNENIRAEYAGIVRLVNQERIPFQEAERRTLGITHAEVGEFVARRWALPDPIPCCIRYHHEPSALPTPDPIVDTLHLADALCLLLGVGGGDDSQMYRVDEAVLERAGVAPGEIEAIGATIVHELKSVQKLFSVE